MFYQKNNKKDKTFTRIEQNQFPAKIQVPTFYFANHQCFPKNFNTIPTALHSIRLERYASLILLIGFRYPERQIYWGLRIPAPPPP